MNRIKNILVKPSVLVIIFFSLALLVVSSAYFELRQSKNEMLHFMSEEAHSLLQSIIVSSQEVVYASDEVESAIRSSLLNNANIIKILYEKNLVTNILLKEIAEKNKLNRIHIIGKNGVKKYTSSIVSSHKQLSADFIKNQLEPIFSNKLDTLIVGFKNAREEEGIRYVVAIASSNNDAIVLNLKAEELLAFKKG